MKSGQERTISNPNTQEVEGEGSGAQGWYLRPVSKQNKQTKQIKPKAMGELVVVTPAWKFEHWEAKPGS